MDVILLDNRMPKMDGLEALKIIRSQGATVKIIILTAYDDEEDIVNFLEAKANCYLLKDASSDDIYHAIRICLEDDYYYPEFVRTILLKNSLQKSEKMSPQQKRIMFLTLRERKVLAMILDNKSKVEIAEILHIGVRIVERIRSSILEKTDMHSIEELILYSSKYHLSDLLIDK